MTYGTGNPILASDFDSFVGTISSTDPFTSSPGPVLSAIYGIGYGSRGYGQTKYKFSAVKQGDNIVGSNWAKIRNALVDCVTHTGVTIANIPAATSFDKGNPISGSLFDWESAITALDTARFNSTSSSMKEVSTISDQRTSEWSEPVTLELLADFGSEDSARFYFNSGGQIRLSATFNPNPLALDPHSASWQALLANLKVVCISANTTTQTGTGGTGSNLGYYALTHDYQRLFWQYDTGTYAVNHVDVYAKREYYTGRNGGNGYAVRVQFIFNNNYSTPATTVNGVLTPPVNPVNGTLSATSSIYFASTPFVISTPNVTKWGSLTSGGGPTYFAFNDTVDSTIRGYNLVNRARAAGYDPAATYALYATLNITGNGVVGANSTGEYALVIPPLSASSTVKIINYGVIAGAGGNGGRGGAYQGAENGTDGGPALLLQYPTTLYNYGVIGGGGGGGGGGGTGYTANNTTYDDPGAGGGGGAGDVSGAGNQSQGVYPNDTYYGKNGSLLNGGGGGVVSPHSSNEWYFGRQGGWGGNLGQPGQPGGYGQVPIVMYGPGNGTGGQHGVAITGMENILNGSYLGDIRSGGLAGDLVNNSGTVSADGTVPGGTADTTGNNQADSGSG